LNWTRRQLLGTQGGGTYSNREIPWRHARAADWWTYPCGFEGSDGDEGGGHDKVAILLSYGTTRVLLAGDAEAKGGGVHSERPLHEALNGE
jgi:hypothetical protein